MVAAAIGQGEQAIIAVKIIEPKIVSRGDFGKKSRRRLFTIPGEKLCAAIVEAVGAYRKEYCADQPVDGLALVL